MKKYMMRKTKYPKQNYIVFCFKNNKFKDLFVELYYEDCKLFGYELPF